MQYLQFKMGRYYFQEFTFDQIKEFMVSNPDFLNERINLIRSLIGQSFKEENIKSLQSELEFFENCKLKIA
tara:strand:- start:27 stop:239 length:213 start_codon:yes stop_codon:yes gene_type:complete